MARTVAWGVEVSGKNAITRALKTLDDTEAPFIRKALEQSGGIMRAAAASRTKPGIAAKITFQGVTGTGGGLQAKLLVDHPGGKAMEFGRHWWFTGSARTVQVMTLKRQLLRTRKNVRDRVYHSPGQVARPYFGIKSGNAAIAEVKPRIQQLLTDAFIKEFETQATAGD